MIKARLVKGHPAIRKKCIICNKRLGVGDDVTLIVLGPGDNKEEQEKCRAGRDYNAVAAPAHWDCAGGVE